MNSPCSSVRFIETQFDTGYIPANTAVVLTGLIGVQMDSGFPVDTYNITITSHCSQVKFPNGSGVYNQDTYSLGIIKGQTTYVPFRINLEDACGEFNCKISYAFTIETVVDGVLKVYDCESETNLVSYNASCDFQKCLLDASEVYCNLDLDCVDDICSNPCYQRFIRLSTIDDILRYKIEQQDWQTVDKLYSIALEQICNCNCDGTVRSDVTEKQIEEVITNE